LLVISAHITKVKTPMNMSNILVGWVVVGWAGKTTLSMQEVNPLHDKDGFSRPPPNQYIYHIQLGTVVRKSATTIVICLWFLNLYQTKQDCLLTAPAWFWKNIQEPLT
jgi:hypothetical protein